jgi:hypothetical protein
MGKLVCVIAVLLAGCAGWGDDPTLSVEGTNLGSVGIFQSHTVYACLDRQDGDSCSDGLWCNGEETCQGGLCVPGEPACETPCDEMHRHCAAECVFDSDCDDGLWCTGQEWCCTWENSELDCQKYHCYQDFSPCGAPLWAPLAICDKTTDTCRGCYSDEECDDGLYCTGVERCSTMFPWQGTCYAHTPPPCIEDPDLVCDEEAMKCVTRPECRADSDCDLEEWCDENGKCQSYNRL